MDDMPERGNPPNRVDPPLIAGERQMLDSWLDFHRETLLWKCDDLTDDQLKTASVPPSSLSLIGLVRHMAEVERGWFARAFGLDNADLYCTEENPDGDFDNVATADVAADLATFRREVATYREHAPSFSLDDEVAGSRGRTFSLRWIYVHMIEEYARHNGHADLLRETIDGATGD